MLVLPWWWWMVMLLNSKSGKCIVLAISKPVKPTPQARGVKSLMNCIFSSLPPCGQVQIFFPEIIIEKTRCQCNSLKFIYSEKAKNFCEIFPLLLSYVVPVKSKVKISQNFVAFSEYMSFKPRWAGNKIGICGGVLLCTSFYLVNLPFG